MSSGAGIFGIGLAMVLALPSAARAQDVNTAEGADATSSFHQGLSEMMAGHYPTGCPALASSFRLDPRPGTLFTLAECNLRWGRSASALAAYDQYLALYGRMSSDQKVKQGERARVATSEREQLEGSVPRLRVEVPETAPAGLVVRLDDVVLQGPMIGAPTPVDPGEHVVRTSTPDGRAAEQHVTIVDGEQRMVVVEPPGAAMPTPVPGAASSPAARTTTIPPVLLAPPTAVASSPSHRPWVLLAGGVGVAGGVVAGIAGGLALQERSTAASGCDARGVCTSQHAVDAGNEARGLANAETAALAVAGAGIVIAVVLWLTESSSARAPAGGGAGVAWGDARRAATW